jgi:hypothetical protein
MPRLIACTGCQTHVRSNEAVCPHCGTALPSDGRFGRTAGAVLMGLTIAGCGPKGSTDDTSEGMSASEGVSTSVGGTTDASSTSAGSGSHGGGSTTGWADDTWGEPQPEYGVPDTGWYEETDTTGESTGGSGDDSTGSTGEADAGEGEADEGPIDTGVEPLYGVGDSGS